MLFFHAIPYGSIYRILEQGSQEERNGVDVTGDFPLEVGRGAMSQAFPTDSGHSVGQRDVGQYPSLFYNLPRSVLQWVLRDSRGCH